MYLLGDGDRQEGQIGRQQLLDLCVGGRVGLERSRQLDTLALVQLQLCPNRPFPFLGDRIDMPARLHHGSNEQSTRCVARPGRELGRHLGTVDDLEVTPDGKTLIVGALLAFGAAAIVLGAAMLDSTRSSMAGSVVHGLAGHLQIYSSEARDELDLFAEQGLRASGFVATGARIRDLVGGHPLSVMVGVTSGASGFRGLLSVAPDAAMSRR